MEPNFVAARWVLGRAYALQGALPQALEEFQRGLAVEPQNTLLQAALARAYSLSGAKNDAQSLLDDLIAARRTRYVSAMDLASVHAAMGQFDNAFDSLNRAVDEHANLLVFLAVDPTTTACATTRASARCCAPWRSSDQWVGRLVLVRAVFRLHCDTSS